MHLIQMMLIYRHRHKLPNAFIESAVNYQIGTGAEGGANAFVVDGRPFSENCGSIEIDLNAGIIHSYRFAFSPMLPVAVSASQSSLEVSTAVNRVPAANMSVESKIEAAIINAPTIEGNLG